jgi:hypothetical protein
LHQQERVCFEFEASMSGHCTENSKSRWRTTGFASLRCLLQIMTLLNFASGSASESGGADVTISIAMDEFYR